MEIKYLIALSFSEFQVLYASGEVRVFRNRPQPVRLNSKGKIDQNSIDGSGLIDRMPHFDIEDEHSIIVGLIDRLPDNGWLGNISQDIHPVLPDVYYLPISYFESFHPLTERGGRILGSRLSDHKIRMLPPIFEEEVLNILGKWSTRRSLTGGMVLSKLLVSGVEYQPNETLVASAISSLKMANSGGEIPGRTGTLIDHLFCYVRRIPSQSTDIGFLIDLGLILSDNNSGLVSHEKLGPLRDFAMRNEAKVDSIVDLLQMSDLRDILNDIDNDIKSPVELSGALLFLKWKSVAQQSNRVDIDQMLAELKLCNAALPGTQLSKVIWLFGFYWGVDSLIPEYYFRDTGNHRFIDKDANIKHKPLALKEKIATPKRKKNPAKKVSKDKSDTKVDVIQNGGTKSHDKPKANTEGKTLKEAETKPVPEPKVKVDKDVIQKPTSSKKSQKAIEKKSTTKKVVSSDKVAQVRHQEAPTDKSQEPISQTPKAPQPQKGQTGLDFTPTVPGDDLSK